MSKVDELDELVVAQPPQVEAGWDYPEEIFGWELPEFGTRAFHTWAKNTFDETMANRVFWATTPVNEPTSYIAITT